MMEILFLNMAVFIKGIKNTILISLVGVVLGSILGSFIALLKLSKIRPLQWIAGIYIEFLRGTPMLVQVFIVFFWDYCSFGVRYFSFNLWYYCACYKFFSLHC